MSREEAIAVFKAFMDNPLFSDIHKAAFSIAIHDIKQRHDWDINKLMLVSKTEWEQEPCDDAISRDEVREILAKYHLGESRIAEELNELPSVQHNSNADKKHVENTLDDAISRGAVLNTEYQVKEINGIEYVMLSEVQMKIRKMPLWLGKNCKDCGNEKCKSLGKLPKGHDCSLWQPESEDKE